MKVIVLGKSPSWQDAGGACSGYLIEHDGCTVLLDCGSGVFGRLRAQRDYLAVDAVLISHLHGDHFLDLLPYASALAYGPRRGHRTPLHAPRGAGRVFRAIAGTWGSDRLVEDAFRLREYDGGDMLDVGPFTVRFCEVPHYVPTFAVELGAAGRRFTFGADCAPNQALVDFARETDLLLIEATVSDPEPEGDRGHLTPSEAGEHARRAGARRLVVTHFSDELDPDRLRREAEAAYGGELELAAPGATYDLIT